jgi:hypothetical protein
MEVQLTSDQKAFVRRAVETGRLHSEEEAVQEALALWEEANAGAWSCWRPWMTPALPLPVAKAASSLRSPCGNLRLKCEIADAPA